MQKELVGCLVVGRRINESVTLKLDENIDPKTPVGDVFGEIEVNLTEISHHQIKLMIRASKNISIVRTELLND